MDTNYALNRLMYFFNVFVTWSEGEPRDAFCFARVMGSRLRMNLKIDDRLFKCGKTHLECQQISGILKNKLWVI